MFMKKALFTAGLAAAATDSVTFGITLGNFKLNFLNKKNHSILNKILFFHSKEQTAELKILTGSIRSVPPRVNKIIAF